MNIGMEKDLFSSTCVGRALVTLQEPRCMPSKWDLNSMPS